MKRFKKFTSAEAVQPYYFLLYARNGRIIINSEMYTAEAGRDGGIEAVKEAAKFRSNFDLVRKEGTLKPYFYFVLKASNGEPVGTSEMYVSKQGAERGIKSVMINSQVV